MQHCGWSDRIRLVNLDPIDSSINSFDYSMPCKHFCKSNETEYNFTRLAAVLVFNGKIYEAIECLNKASDLVISGKDSSMNDMNNSISLNAIALALSGYMSFISQIESCGQKNPWFEMCANLKPKLNDPYIKAIFTFISLKSYNDASYSEIIVSNFLINFSN